MARDYILKRTNKGCLAQLARASRLHREGRGFEPLNTHQKGIYLVGSFFC
ncbi:MAG: hypothetical protein UU40_C0012G0009 [Candidatus Uhrbacteria bacterium GW2011_GWD2_41_121]|uniref:Uncharacterized protein n=1 Tax=Candidatus Uhrbacteria bacterium GW2011_GWC1_41_20 TaxID=1618983 RepID=A0A0G0XPZ4_9BACT|nr:MAG: hypothetical protein UT52_C0004G0009 [Candidatus Uhrbacteria bacterium GW2011_GWE1_39_46]KKR63795.1 MAG: hypothetical protein UU04_C0012G0033 [Candidatus Uhrbacteria bacterium GW2011_GWC2_40_450]KKR89901.1 MAG: hypothetical protein UU40_C0012G0009 [Candidatus Uhrbacteria bacterium GW2011_GWD2_41_121]KKR95771.1 MAG: hypothetical protein UU46_C0014G0009 [Candidatus Uhrbacteria bacterium GW2011_GWD1_41_16]KKR98885.1 MAG: hypothetical protein UU50_C0014G0017 [Candidatus Uhrbacteria bacteriu